MKREVARLLRMVYMRTTSLSRPWAGSRSYVKSLYSLWSKVYDWTINWDPAYRRNARRMIAATVGEGGSVLDVGVGTGLLAEYGAPLVARYVGIDYSDAMIKQATKKVATHHLDNVELRQGDARKLPFDGDEFDSVVSSFALPHFGDDEKVDVLAEMRRVLKPNGRLGLFLAQGEMAPLFSLRRELVDDLAAAGFTDVHFEDRDDVYRIVLAKKPL